MNEGGMVERYNDSMLNGNNAVKIEVTTVVTMSVATTAPSKPRIRVFSLSKPPSSAWVLLVCIN